MPGLFHAHNDIVIWVQEGRYELQAVALQDLDVQWHAFGIALDCPNLQTAQRELLYLQGDATHLRHEHLSGLAT